MTASDSETSVPGVDVTVTAVHPSPFRDPTTGDEIDGQEIPFEAPEGRDVQVVLDPQRTLTTPVSGSSDAEVPEVSQPVRLHERKCTTLVPNTGIRYVRRAHRHARYRHVGAAPCSANVASSSEICVSLCRLGSNTNQKFEEAKRLRCRDTPLAALYPRARLLKFVDEPWQARARKCLQSALRYRHMAIYLLATHL